MRTHSESIRRNSHETDFKWVPYFGTVLNAGNGTTIIPTVILPVDDGDNAREIQKSMKFGTRDSGYSLSFTWKGEILKYDFTSTEKGLVLR